MQLFTLKAMSFIALLLSVSVHAHEHGSHQKAEYTLCPEERSQMCTREYRPVCASVEVHCFKAPCPAIKRTYANGCEACANEHVLGFVPGSCSALEMKEQK